MSNSYISESQRICIFTVDLQWLDFVRRTNQFFGNGTKIVYNNSIVLYPPNNRYILDMCRPKGYGLVSCDWMGGTRSKDRECKAKFLPYIKFVPYLLPLYFMGQY